MDDTFVEDDFVSLRFFDALQCLSVRVLFDLVWIVDSDLSRVVGGLCHFVDDILFEQVKV